MATTSTPAPTRDRSPEIPSIGRVAGKPLPRRATAAWWLLAALVITIGVAAYVYWRTPSAATYITARVTRGDIESTVTTTGNLNAVITVQVGSQVSGNIIALYADFNTKVKKGQMVAEIDPAPFKASMQQATAMLNAAIAAVGTAEATLTKSQSDLATAQANVANQNANLVKAKSAVVLARIENERKKSLVNAKISAQEDADIAQAAYEQAVAAVDASQAAVTAAVASAESALKGVDVARRQLEQANAVVAQNRAIVAQAQLNLDHTRILAPVDGTVVSRNMDVGQTVAASFQAPVIFLIAKDLTKMQVDTNVDEADVGPIRLDQAATFTVDAYPGQIFKGRVAQIRQAPINVQNVITYDIVVEVANPDLKLFPGMTANVSIFTGRASGVLRIPKAALRFRPRPGSTQGPTVYVLENGQPKETRIQTGISNANFTELTGGGILENQEVITGTAAKAGAPAPQSQGSPGTRRLGF